MKRKMKTRFLWAGVAALMTLGVLLISLSFGGTQTSAPGAAVEAVYTNAALTVAAQQQTLTAAQPTATATLAPALLEPPSPTASTGVLPTFSLANTPAATLAAGCDAAVYVSDVTVPDGTTIPAGQSFLKTWKVMNTGSCAWSPGYQLVFFAGDSLGGKATPIGLTVPPGAIAEVSVTLTSTYAQGTIEGKWRLANDKGVPFGDVLTVVINSVPAATATPTLGAATPEPTEEAPTEEPTATAEGSSP